MALRHRLRAYRQLLFTPDEFFDRRTPREGIGVRGVALAAALQAGLLVVLTVLLSLLLVGRSGGEVTVDTLTAIATNVVIQGIYLGFIVVLDWFVLGAILHVVLLVVGGKGTVGDTLFVVGWSVLVTPLQLLAVGATILVTLLTSPPGGDVGDQLAAAEPTLVTVLSLATLVVFAWQAYIWHSGLQRTHDLGSRTAGTAAVVAILVAIALATVAG